MLEEFEKEIDQLQRNIRVLEITHENEPIGVVEISNEMDSSIEKIRDSLRTLQEEDLIEPTSEGATTTGQVGEFVSVYNQRIDTIVHQLQKYGVEGTNIESNTTEFSKSSEGNTDLYENKSEREGSDTKIYQPDEYSQPDQ